MQPGAKWRSCPSKTLRRLPLWCRYDQNIDSKVADVNNVAAGGMAGSIICALFLKRFVTATRSWLHFDIYAWTPVATLFTSATLESMVWS